MNREPVAVQVARGGWCAERALAGCGTLGEKYSAGFVHKKQARTGYAAAQYPRNRTCDTLLLAGSNFGLGSKDGLCGTEQRNGANSNFQ